MDKVSIFVPSTRDEVYEDFEFRVRGFKRTFTNLPHKVSLDMQDLGKGLQLSNVSLYVENYADTDECLKLISDFIIDLYKQAKNVKLMAPEALFYESGVSTVCNDLIMVMRLLIKSRKGELDKDLIFEYVKPILDIISAPLYEDVLINTNTMIG